MATQQKLLYLAAIQMQHCSQGIFYETEAETEAVQKWTKIKHSSSFLALLALTVV